MVMQWSEKAGLVTSQDEFVDIYGLDPDVRVQCIQAPFETEACNDYA